MRLSRFVSGGLLLLSVALPFSASASLIPIGFGGTVVTVIPCVTAPGFFSINILEPELTPPFLNINTYVVSLTSPFLSHIPPHPGQHVLGKVVGFYACIIDPNPKHFIKQIEPLSIFYGSSV